MVVWCRWFLEVSRTVSSVVERLWFCMYVERRRTSIWNARWRWIIALRWTSSPVSRFHAHCSMSTTRASLRRRSSPTTRLTSRATRSCSAHWTTCWLRSDIMRQRLTCYGLSAPTATLSACRILFISSSPTTFSSTFNNCTSASTLVCGFLQLTYYLLSYLLTYCLLSKGTFSTNWLICITCISGVTNQGFNPN